MALFWLAFRRSVKSLWIAALFSLLFSLVFLLLYASGDVFEGVYRESIGAQNTYTFTLQTDDLSKFADTSLFAYSVTDGRDYNVEISANGRSQILSRDRRGISFAVAGSGLAETRPDMVYGTPLWEATEDAVWLSQTAAVFLFGEGEEDGASYEQILAHSLGQSVSIGGAQYRVAGIFGPFFSVYIGAAEPTFVIGGGQAEKYFAAVPARGLAEVSSLLAEGEYEGDGGALQLVRGMDLLESFLAVISAAACLFGAFVSVKLFGAYFTSKERQNTVLRACGACRSRVFWLNFAVLGAAGLLSLALSVPLFYGWRAIVEALSRSIMNMRFGGTPQLALYLACSFAAYLALAAAVCAARAFARRGGEVSA